jgi:hypothetical protein
MGDTLFTVEQAQLEQAKAYRKAASQAPHNSRTRKGWLLLAEQAEAAARHVAEDRALRLSTSQKLKENQ